MRKPTKKRIKFDGNQYWPQYRWYGFWLKYHYVSMMGTYPRSFCTMIEADDFLLKDHDSELEAINAASTKKIIEWNPV